MSEKKSEIPTSQDIEYYKYFYDFAPIGFYTTKISDGEFLLANPTCIKMLGFKTFEELKNNCRSTQLYPPRQRNKLIQSVIKHGSVTNFETEFDLKNGKKIWINLSARLSKTKDCLEGSITDITDKILLQEELDNYKKKGLENLIRMSAEIDERIRNIG